MKLYHSTTRENADAILAFGFRDATDYYMTAHQWTGVWLSDRPLNENEGALTGALLSLDIDEAELVPYEWVEDGKGYREFLVPAALTVGRDVVEVDPDD